MQLAPAILLLLCLTTSVLSLNVCYYERNETRRCPEGIQSTCFSRVEFHTNQIVVGRSLCTNYGTGCFVHGTAAYYCACDTDLCNSEENMKRMAEEFDRSENGAHFMERTFAPETDDAALISECATPDSAPIACSEPRRHFCVSEFYIGSGVPVFSAGRCETRYFENRCYDEGNHFIGCFCNDSSSCNTPARMQNMAEDFLAAQAVRRLETTSTVTLLLTSTKAPGNSADLSVLLLVSVALSCTSLILVVAVMIFIFMRRFYAHHMLAFPMMRMESEVSSIN